jgi:hypothetical protein
MAEQQQQQQQQQPQQQQQAQAAEGKGGGAKSPAQAPKKLLRYQGIKPKYHVNEAHVKGSGRYNPRKDPLPADAAEVHHVSGMRRYLARRWARCMQLEKYDPTRD